MHSGFTLKQAGFSCNRKRLVTMATPWLAPKVWEFCLLESGQEFCLFLWVLFSDKQHISVGIVRLLCSLSSRNWKPNWEVWRFFSTPLPQLIPASSRPGLCPNIKAFGYALRWTFSRFASSLWTGAPDLTALYLQSLNDEHRWETEELET